MEKNPAFVKNFEPLGVENSNYEQRRQTLDLKMDAANGEHIGETDVDNIEISSAASSLNDERRTQHPEIASSVYHNKILTLPHNDSASLINNDDGYEKMRVQPEDLTYSCASIQLVGSSPTHVNDLSLPPGDSTSKANYVNETSIIQMLSTDTMHAPAMSRDNAVTLINMAVAARNGVACNGLYIIRRSDKSHDLVLSFFFNSEILHYEILHQKPEQFQIRKSTAAGVVHGNTFNSVQQLLNHYTGVLSEHKDDMMPCRLTELVCSTDENGYDIPSTITDERNHHYDKISSVTSYPNINFESYSQVSCQSATETNPRNSHFSTGYMELDEPSLLNSTYSLASSQKTPQEHVAAESDAMYSLASGKNTILSTLPSSEPLHFGTTTVGDGMYSLASAASAKNTLSSAIVDDVYCLAIHQP